MATETITGSNEANRLCNAGGGVRNAQSQRPALRQFSCSSTCFVYCVCIAVDWLVTAMSHVPENRLDPSLLNRRDREFLDRFTELVAEEERPYLAGREGVHIELPDAIFHHLVRVVRSMREGKAVILMPEKETLTTQAIGPKQLSVV